MASHFSTNGASASSPSPSSSSAAAPAAAAAAATTTADSNGDGAGAGADAGVGASINDIPKSWNFTSKLPADQVFPTPADSHRTPRDRIGPRQVRGALFTWVRPNPVEAPELLAVSPAAMRDLGIRAGDERTPDFLATVAGNRIQGWDDRHGDGDGDGKAEAEAGAAPGYPWAQCYGGFQFGSWAGQLGDGRAISLFETTNPATGERYEVQLKGAGMTPYSRFADGKAVLRSSIREFVVSEALHALGIPTTRALSLTLLPGVKVVRERVEPGAIVARFAQSWLRFGTFDLLRARGDRTLIRRLATYVAEDVFGGWDKLPGRLEDPAAQPTAAESSSNVTDPVRRGVAADAVEGPSGAEENRFARLYREVARRNAVTVARWQAYGFMNGVLNTDNTSVAGLSMDYGPFAFMDDFDPAYTPNHDDHLLRYAYRSQPTVVWWNLVRLGEALGELIGAGAQVDDEKFRDDGVSEDLAPDVISRAEKLITQTGDEYRAVFMAEYRRAMAARLGLKQCKEGDFEDLFSEALDILEAHRLDFHLFFRRLGGLRLCDLAESDEARRERAGVFLHHDSDSGSGSVSGSKDKDDEQEARRRLAAWLDRWRRRVAEDWGGDGATGNLAHEADARRRWAMHAVNPRFVPRGWVLDELIRRVERGGERDVLERVMKMALDPFREEGWGGDAEEEARWTGDPPRVSRAMQCSCSS
ncbi:UPF0061-domain-containing protein [Xylariaceae sp. FL0804]|nr:UPF0061-domain-containing protein [Xylariaceae sp. FL0804]